MSAEREMAIIGTGVSAAVWRGIIMDTRRLTDAEINEYMRDYPRPTKPAHRTVPLSVAFAAAFMAALFGLLVGIDPMGLYVAEVLK